MKKLLIIAALTAVAIAACGGEAHTGGAAAPALGRPGSGQTLAGGPDGSLKADAGRAAPAQAGQAGSPSSLEVPPPNEGPRVVRTGRMTLQVPNGSFSDKLDELGFAIRTYKGYISGTDSQAPESGGLRVATITYQIPSGSFDDALASIRKLGTMQSISLTGQDVGSQYVDLNARLKVQEEQRDFYLALLAQAKTTQELISVRTQLGPILDQIERLKGQIAYLDHATTYATLSVTLREAAAGLKPPTDTWGFRSSVTEAARLFVNTVNWVVLALGAIGPRRAATGQV
jgi:hypothetical protein